MGKKLGLLIFHLSLYLLCIPASFARYNTLNTIARVPVPLQISVSHANWTTTFSICNNTANVIPLNDIELDFNYSAKIPGNIWGMPWASWHVGKDGPGSVQLLGGSFINYPPDPTCKSPITVTFQASPETTLPTTPFVFKAAMESSAGAGKINVSMPLAPASGLSNPKVTIAGNGITQEQIVGWGNTWLLSNLIPGGYTVTASPVNNGTEFFTANPISVTVNDQATTEARVVYNKVTANQGSLNINIGAAPASGVSNPTITVTGGGTTKQQVVTWGNAWLLSNLPTGSYTVTSSTISNSTDSYQAAPVTVTINASTTTQANLTYTRVQTGRPGSWNNIKHIVVVILENERAAHSLAQPFMKSLPSKGGYTSQMYAITHPSQPNYIALVAGSTLGVTSNGDYNLDGKHIGDLLDAKGLTWKAYAEDLPSVCFKGDSGKYDRKHEPFISFKSVQNNPTQCAKIVNATQFMSDLTSNKLPAFALYIPNENNNGHDTGVAYADKWLQRVFGPLFDKPEVMAETLFIITYDEDDGGANNNIYTAFVGAAVKPGATSSKRYTLYSMLRTIEEIYQLGNLGRNDASAAVINDIWQP